MIGAGWTMSLRFRKDDSSHCVTDRAVPGSYGGSVSHVVIDVGGLGFQVACIQW